MGFSFTPTKLQSLYYGSKTLLALPSPPPHSPLSLQPLTAPALRAHVPPRPVSLTVLFTWNAPCSRLLSGFSPTCLRTNGTWEIQDWSSPKQIYLKLLTSQSVPQDLKQWRPNSNRKLSAMKKKKNVFLPSTYIYLCIYTSLFIRML